MVLPIPDAGLGLRTDDLSLVNAINNLNQVNGTTGITATASGTVSTSVSLSLGLNNITTAASGSGVLLPRALEGVVCFVANSGANAVTVFAPNSATINGTAGATGVSQTNALSAIYWCPADGVYLRLLSA